MSEVPEISEESNDLFSMDTDTMSETREYEAIPGSSVKKRKNHLQKPLTVEELNNLKETEYLYNNNLFRLQVEELLAETPIKNKRHNLIQKWKKFFEEFIKTLPDYTVQLSSIMAAKNSKSKVEPLTKSLSKNTTDLETDDDLMLTFGKPLCYETFGLYENGCQPGPDIILNVHLTMPEICFRVKDYLNNRYIVKKYYYLLYIEEYLKKCDMVTTIKLTYHNNNFLLPILKFHLENDQKVTINIFVSADKNTFKSSRFLPDRNNVNQNIFCPKVALDVLKNTPTVYYNSTLGFDGTLTANICYLSETLRGLKNLQDAIKLLCIWLKQRGLDLIGFTEDLIVYFVVYLYEKKRINNYMSSYQIIKNFWNFINISDLKNEPIRLGTESEHFMEIFKEYYDVIFLDKTGYYNLTSFLIKEVYDKVKSESASALKILNDNVHNSFHQLFLNKYPFYLQFDLTIKISELTWKQCIPLKEQALFSGYYYYLMIQNLLKTLKYALDKRYLHIIPKIETEGNKITKLFIGINLNPDEAFNNLTLGPAINDVTAVEFRDFWGTLESDRRFRDGSVHCAVHFKANTVRSKRRIIVNILEFVLGQKLDLEYEIYYDDLEDHLLNKMLVPSYPCGTNEETTLKIVKAWDALGQFLRELNVVLQITGIQAISDIFCYADAFPPIPQNFEEIDYSSFLAGEADEVPPHIQPIYSVFQFEQNSKWPNNLGAICSLKASFYLQIAYLLKTMHNITARVAPDYIEIAFHGLVFRYILFVKKEIDLAKEVSHETPMTQSVDSFEMKKRYVFLPKIIGGLKGVQAEYPSFGPGTALIKRWLRAQLIDDFYFADIAVDLINASLYLNSPSNNVNTPQASFLRFLNFFSDFDGHHQVVVVNFNDILTENEINQQESKFVEGRHSYPNLFILTPYDESLSIFTQENPSKEILARIKKLCHSSLDFVEGVTSGKLNITMQEISYGLFMPKYDGYNVLIHLKNSLNSRRYEKIVALEEDDRVVIEKLEDDVNTVLPPVVDFNPVDKYLQTLRKNYGKYALFFHDSYGGNIIGVLWHSEMVEAVGNFKALELNRMKLYKGKLDFNKDAAIEDFNVLGVGLVESIDRLT